jgi:hypothetical protein
MKSQDFANFAADFAAVLKENGAVDGGAAWAQFASMFTFKPTAKVADICRLFGDDTSPTVNGPQLEVIARSIPGLLRLMGPKPKKPLADDLHLVAQTIAPLTKMGVGDLVQNVSSKLASQGGQRLVRSKAAMNAEVVERHVAALEQSYRDEVAFKLAYTSLKADQSAKAPEVKEIAKRFAGAGGKNKAESLNAIWRRHEVILIDRAKAAATAGRTAA